MSCKSVTPRSIIAFCSSASDLMFINRRQLMDRILDIPEWVRFSHAIGTDDLKENILVSVYD
ncbi:MAG: hypothetical protein ACQEXQ_14645 [Bacillota bacterium]